MEKMIYFHQESKTGEEKRVQKQVLLTFSQESELHHKKKFITGIENSLSP